MRGFNFTVYLSVRPSVCLSVHLFIHVYIYRSLQGTRDRQGQSPELGPLTKI